MLDTTYLKKPSLITEMARDEYAMRFVIRNRKSWRKLRPEQRSTILLAAAAQMETWAAQMREEASGYDNHSGQP